MEAARASQTQTNDIQWLQRGPSERARGARIQIARRPEAEGGRASETAARPLAPHVSVRASSLLFIAPPNWAQSGLALAESKQSPQPTVELALASLRSALIPLGRPALARTDCARRAISAPIMQRARGREETSNGKRGRRRP